MSALAISLLWAALLWLLYTYLGYPLLLAAWSRWRSRPWARSSGNLSVTVVIAGWDEGPRLKRRLDNLLAQDYPAANLDVVFVSDGSSDNTDEVVRTYGSKRVTFVSLERRGGKAAALNQGLTAANGEIIVFADARQCFAADAVAKLVANFADPEIGAVSGELVLQSALSAHAPRETGLYWKIEKWIRRKEADIDSVIGATGAIYAIRRSLYEPLPQGTILDDLVIPMRIALKGYRVVFDSRARAFDSLASDYRHEFRRKVRTLAGNYQALRLCPELALPWRNRLFIQFASHKLCRLLAPYMMLLLFGANAFHAQGAYGYLLGFQTLFYSLALVGWLLARMGSHEKVTATAFTFCLLNVAALVGSLSYLRGHKNVWAKGHS